jgi:hypothetical protein
MNLLHVVATFLAIYATDMSYRLRHLRILGAIERQSIGYLRKKDDSTAVIIHF